MKTLVAALALLALAAGPVFAQTIVQPQVPQSGYFGSDTNNPALTGGGSLGHNRLQQRF
jgi:opacity protein-like surface antigen